MFSKYHTYMFLYKTYFRTKTGFNLGLASSSESVYSSYSEDCKKVQAIIIFLQIYPQYMYLEPTTLAENNST